MFLGKQAVCLGKTTTFHFIYTLVTSFFLFHAATHFSPAFSVPLAGILLLCGFYFRLALWSFFLSCGFAFGILPGIMVCNGLLAAGLSFSFYAVKKHGLSWSLRLRKQHDRSFEFVREPFQNGFFWAFRNRFLMIVPQDNFTLGAGASRVRFFPYLAGSILGLFPQTVALCFLANPLRNVFLENTCALEKILIAAGSATALAFFPLFYRHMNGWGSEQ